MRVARTQEGAGMQISGPFLFLPVAPLQTIRDHVDAVVFPLQP